MARCVSNLQIKGLVLIHIKHGQIIALRFKIERKNTNQCSRGFRMEDQRVQSPQTITIGCTFSSKLSSEYRSRS